MNIGQDRVSVRIPHEELIKQRLEVLRPSSKIEEEGTFVDSQDDYDVGQGQGQQNEVIVGKYTDIENEKLDFLNKNLEPQNYHRYSLDASYNNIKESEGSKEADQSYEHFLDRRASRTSS